MFESTAGVAKPQCTTTKSFSLMSISEAHLTSSLSVQTFLPLDNGFRLKPFL